MSEFTAIATSSGKRYFQPPFLVKINILAASLFCAPFTADAQSLKYFGYYGCWGTPPLEDCVKETADWSNVVIISYLEGQPISENVYATLEERRVKAILDVGGLLFDHSDPGHYRFWEECLGRCERWERFLEESKIRENISLIQAFYLLDEPMVHGVSASDLLLAARLIKATFPDVPIILVEAGTEEHLSRLQIPSEVDWVGIDRYGFLDPSKDKAYLRVHNILKAKLRAHQKIVLVMDAWWKNDFHGKTILDPRKMALVAYYYYLFAQNNPQVVALLPFIWYSFSDGYGTRDLPPEVLITHQNIGRAITDKKAPPGESAIGRPCREEGPCRSSDGSLVCMDRREFGVFSWHPANYAPTCEDRDRCLRVAFATSCQWPNAICYPNTGWRFSGEEAPYSCAR